MEYVSPKSGYVSKNLKYVLKNFKYVSEFLKTTRKQQTPKKPYPKFMKRDGYGSKSFPSIVQVFVSKTRMQVSEGQG